MKTGTGAIDTLLAANGFVVRPSARQRIMVDQVSQSRGLPGYTVNVNTDMLSAYLTDAIGRHAHLVGIRFETAVKLTGATPVKAVTGHALRGLIYNVKLQGQDGWMYTGADCDMRDVMFDAWARHGHLVNSPPLSQDYNPDNANPAVKGSNLYPIPYPAGLFGVNPTDNLDGVALWRDISCDFNLIGKNGAMNGIIPLAEILNNNGKLQFKLASTLPYAAGYTVNQYGVQGETETAVRVIFDVVYSDVLMAGRRSILDNYVITVAQSPLKYPSFSHTYAAFRWREEDIATTADVPYYEALTNADEIDNLIVTIGGTQEVQGLTATQLRARLRSLVERHPRGELTTWDRGSALPAFRIPTGAATGMPTDGTDYLARLCEFIIPYNQRGEHRPSGAVSFQVKPSSIPASGLLRVVHRVEGDLMDAPIKAARDCGCKVPNAVTKVSTDAHGNAMLLHGPGGNRARR